ncbi:MAG: hypothetical protein C0503_00500 [Gemmatimonas sp.]|nr:hypothetical protein [Gemmatimonas sp.]
MPRLLKRLLIVGSVLFVVTAVLTPVPTVQIVGQMYSVLPSVTAPSRTLFDDSARVPMPDWIPATDSSISLAEGGRLLRTLFPLQSGTAPLPAFILPQPELSILWDGAPLDSVLFPDARANGNPMAVFDRTRIFTSVKRGLSPEERAYAANVAGDSVWTLLDRLARATGADVAAASLVMPVAPDLALSAELPIPRFSRANAIADGAALRAATLVVDGDRAAAEASLASLYAVGLLLHRDGMNLLESLLGYRMALNAIMLRRALHEAYPVATSAAVMASADSVRDSDRRRSARRPAADPDSSARRLALAIASLVEAAESPNIPRARRFEAVALLGISACTSTKTLLFGTDDAAQRAQATAMQTLPRSAAESAYVASLSRQSESVRFTRLAPGRAWRLYRSSNRMFGAITGNPRLRACSEVATSLVAY